MECQLDKITVHYEIFGEGRPIIMLHGWPVDHRHMVKDFEPLFKHRDGWKRIYPDMPGMGKTPGADWITHQDQMLEILLNFIDTIIPGQRFVVAGTSYGGYLARGLVYRRAAMMDGVFLMIPNIKSDAESQNLPAHITLIKDEALVSELEPDEAEFFQGFAVVQSRELLNSLRIDVLPAFEIADHDFLDKVNYKFSFDVDALSEPFAKPTLILLGRQDSVVGYADAWDILENYPRASFVVLDRAGHGLGEEQKELFKALANEWLDRVEECAG